MSSKSHSINPRRVQQLIQADTRSCEALLDLLQQEQTALGSRNRRDLDALLTAKSQHTQALEAGARQRQQLLQEAGLEADAEVWTQTLAGLDERYPGIHLSDSWQALTQSFEQCQKHNDINGKMIARGQQTMSRLLNLLRGQSAAPGLYDRAGSTEGKGAGSGNVVKA